MRIGEIDPDSSSGKFVSVRRLKEILAELHDECLIGPNKVGNLAVIFGCHHEFIGYIDLLKEAYESAE